eukprot:GHVL01018444.1.p1 GENE.GHVL01018444.1~~GHVL01018444.1.p1  ORF type:complete len:294 (+),score=27.17 GHVL01018444.1:49-930(+)
MFKNIFCGHAPLSPKIYHPADLESLAFPLDGKHLIVPKFFSGADPLGAAGRRQIHSVYFISLRSWVKSWRDLEKVLTEISFLDRSEFDVLPSLDFNRAIILTYSLHAHAILGPFLVEYLELKNGGCEKDVECHLWSAMTVEERLPYSKRRLAENLLGPPPGLLKSQQFCPLRTNTCKMSWPYTFLLNGDISDVVKHNFNISIENNLSNKLCGIVIDNDRKNIKRRKDSWLDSDQSSSGEIGPCNLCGDACGQDCARKAQVLMLEFEVKLSVHEGEEYEKSCKKLVNYFFFSFS